MIFRKSDYSDLPGIMEVINGAKEFFKYNSIDQWQNGYPNEETIKNDINLGNSYVLEDDDFIYGTIALSFEEEQTYNKIYDGDWITHGEYGVIHRICVHQEYKGKKLAELLMTEAEKITMENDITSIKIDTHLDNMPMRKLLYNLNYEECGMILLLDGAKRIAFEKVLD